MRTLMSWESVAARKPRATVDLLPIEEAIRSSSLLPARCLFAWLLAMAVLATSLLFYCLPHRGRAQRNRPAPSPASGLGESSLGSSSLSSVPGGFSIVRVKAAPGREERYWDWTPLRLVQVGNGNVSLATSEGTYVSVHVDGNVSAYAQSAGPNEIFEEVWPFGCTSTTNCSTIALKSSIGNYLRVDQDGVLVAGDADDVVGRNETFTKSGGEDGVEVFLKSNGRMLSTVNTRLTLLTTTFVPPWGDNAHLHEVYSALLVNLQNEAVYDLHVLTETDCGLLRKTIGEWAGRTGNATQIRKDLNQKLVCVPSPTGAQPKYKDFFVYANKSLSGRLVLLHNADIVFDETLRRIAPERILSGEIALILSVSPPPWDGLYKEIFGRNCHTTPKCAVGAWQGAPGYLGPGWSWDGFVFGTPLPSKFDLEQVNMVMNMMGAEYVAAYQFESTGVKLYNPCEHIHTYHWHCQGGKMHGQRLPYSQQAVANIYPCSYCPGITMPKDQAKKEDLCRSGFEQWSNQIPQLFKMPDISARVCCASQDGCWSLDLWSTPACRGPDDTNCIIWEFVGQKKFFTHGR